MDIKKLLLGTITGGVVFLLLGWLFYDTLLVDFLRHNPGEAGQLGRAETRYVYLVAGQLLQGLLFTIILLWSGANSFGTALIPGAITGFLFTAALDLTFYGTSEILSKKGMAADILAATVIASLASGMIGLVIRDSK